MTARAAAPGAVVDALVPAAALVPALVPVLQLSRLICARAWLAHFVLHDTARSRGR